MNHIYFNDLGNISYQDAFNLQDQLFNDNISIKLKKRVQPENDDLNTKNYLLFCEHPHVITLGKSGDINNLLFNEQSLLERGIEFFKTNRGGDITYHGPGQIVGYPIFDIESFSLDIHKYVFSIEETIIHVLSEYGIEGGRIDGMTGVWLDIDKQVPRKICAIGVKASRYITMHGFAFNINTDLNYFNYIVPCGITGKEVTSLSKEMGQKIDSEKVKIQLKEAFKKIFKSEIDNIQLEN